MSRCRTGTRDSDLPREVGRIARAEKARSRPFAPPPRHRPVGMCSRTPAGRSGAVDWTNIYGRGPDPGSEQPRIRAGRGGTEEPAGRGPAAPAPALPHVRSARHRHRRNRSNVCCRTVSGTASSHSATPDRSFGSIRRRPGTRRPHPGTLDAPSEPARRPARPTASTPRAGREPAGAPVEASAGGAFAGAPAASLSGPARPPPRVPGRRPTPPSRRPPGAGSCRSRRAGPSARTTGRPRRPGSR